MVETYDREWGFEYHATCSRCSYRRIYILGARARIDVLTHKCTKR